LKSIEYQDKNKALAMSDWEFAKCILFGKHLFRPMRFFE